MITASDRAYADKATEDMIRAYEDGFEIVLSHISFENPDRTDGLWPVQYAPETGDGGCPFMLPGGAKRYGGEELRAVPPVPGSLVSPPVPAHEGRDRWEDR